jgi:hypothetical protein
MTRVLHHGIDVSHPEQIVGTVTSAPGASYGEALMRSVFVLIERRGEA